MMIRKQGDWLTAKVGDELVMMSAEKGNYLAQLETEFEVASEVCRAEVESFLNELASRGLSATHRRL